MDISFFINSKDIRDYYKKINYKYNTIEAAWLISQCQHITLNGKHEAWELIINNMPDQKTGDGIGIHKIITELIDMENSFIEEFKTTYIDWFFVYRYGPRCSDGGFSLADEDGFFSSWYKCVKGILGKKAPEDANYVVIGRRECDRIEDFQAHGWVAIDWEGSIIKVCPEFVGENAVYYSDLSFFFDSLEIEFPVPFKRGDIVFANNRLVNKPPMVFTDNINLNYIHGEYMDFEYYHGDGFITVPDKELIEITEAIMDEYDEAFKELGQ